MERLRELFAQVIGGDPAGVALVPARSYGLAIAAHNAAVRHGQRVLLVADEYPSTVYTWRPFSVTYLWVAPEHRRQTRRVG